MRSHVVRGLLAGLLLFSVAPATAQLFRAYLALDGLDTNPCTLQQPCRLLPAAINAVASGGEIWMLDSANYNAGPVAITKSVTILAVPGALGSVVALGGAAVVIATPGVNVALRNVHIRPFPGNEAQLGIHMSDGARLMLDGCVVEGFEGGGGHGLVVLAPAHVAIIGGVFRGNYTAATFDHGATARISRSHFTEGTYGISAGAEVTGTTRIFVTHTHVSHFGYGIYTETTTATGVTRVYVSDAVVESNVYGIRGNAGVGETSRVFVANSLVAANTTGIQSNGSGSRIVVSGSTILDNGTALVQSVSAVLESAGNNILRDNVSNSSGTVTTVPGTL